MHGLLQATHLAFAHHFPLVISPDDVWGCIAQGFSRHVAASAGALDERLARSKEPVELRVTRNHFVPGRDNDWAGVTAEFCEMMKPHLMGLSDLPPFGKIRSLTLRGCRFLDSLDGLEKLWNLRELRIESARRLDDIDALAALLDLEAVTLKECEILEKISPIARNKSLRRVIIEGCPLLPGWAQGSFEGEALRALQERLRSLRPDRESAP